ncbi:MAG: 2'-5' RNA ligase family protein [Cyanobacteriota bacterium]|nr:2'-5' RNA ligase family protein [Cyanobacteriota bacterium]
MLEPDATMVDLAQASNARLRAVHPAGFALNEGHRPHITLLQRFVRTQELNRIADAAGRVFADTNLAHLAMEAYGYYFLPAQGLGLAGIVARPSPELIRLQGLLIEAIAPYTVATGAIHAFTASHGDSLLDAALIDYVATFVPNHTGERFSPHVTTGLAPIDVLEAMQQEHFTAFTFAPVGAALVQLGPYGTAARNLRTWG